jgi:hypothetical protein
MMLKATLWLWLLVAAFGVGGLILCYYVDRWGERKFKHDQLLAWDSHLSKALPRRGHSDRSANR